MAKAKKPPTKKAPTKKPIAEKAASIEEPKPATPEPVEEQPAANLQWSSDPQFGPPPKSVRIGMKVYELPDAETQRQGFYSPHAQKLARTIKAYKLIQTKG